MEAEQCIRLKNNLVFLQENVDFEIALDMLFQENKIENHEKEIIRAEVTTNQKIAKLLTTIERKEGAYDIFVNSQSRHIKVQLNQTQITEEDLKRGKITYTCCLRPSCQPCYL